MRIGGPNHPLPSASIALKQLIEAQETLRQLQNCPKLEFTPALPSLSTTISSVEEAPQTGKGEGLRKEKDFSLNVAVAFLVPMKAHRSRKRVRHSEALSMKRRRCARQRQRCSCAAQKLVCDRRASYGGVQIRAPQACLASCKRPPEVGDAAQAWLDAVHVQPAVYAPCCWYLLTPIAVHL